MTPSFDVSPALNRDLHRWRTPAFLGGGVLLIVSIIGAIANPNQFYRSYLMAFLFCLSLPLGSMALIMIQYLTGGAWGVVVRRPLEAAMRTLPLLVILFIPIVTGMSSLYSWRHPAVVAADPVLRHRAVYMNAPAFIIRAVVYFAIWLLFAYLLTKWSDQEDRNGNRLSRLATISAPGLVVYVFTMTFASIDWGESLVDQWSSTIWGFMFVVSQGLTAMAFVIIVLVILSRRDPLSEAVNTSHFHDLGKLLFMFVMLWGYMEFSQLLIVWAGNLTDEIPWYLPAFRTSWEWTGFALIGLQFLLPFALLLSRDIKRNTHSLFAVAAFLILMRFVDLFWIVMPHYHPAGFQFHWLNFTVPLALVGIWIGAYLRQLQTRPLLPLQAPNLVGAIHHGRH